MLLIAWGNGPASHPFYVSVTEITQDAKEKSLEVSCKMFTDDLENTINRVNRTKIDILALRDSAMANKLIGDYINNHLKITVDGKRLSMQFIGFEKEGGAIWSHLQINDVSTIKGVEIRNDLLYDSFDNQIGIIHITINNKRQSTKLNNPEKNASFIF